MNVTIPKTEQPDVILHVWTTAGDEPRLSNYFVVYGDVVIHSNLGHSMGRLYSQVSLEMSSTMKSPCSKARDNVYPAVKTFDLRYWLPELPR